MRPTSGLWPKSYRGKKIEMEKQINIIMSGVGGQGIVKAGQLIGQAVASSGLKVVMSEIHGMSQRGGVVGVDLRIGNVHGPIIPEGIADLVIGFEAVETLRAIGRIGKNTTVIMSTEKIIPVSVSLGDSTYPDTEKIARELKEQGTKLFLIDALSQATIAGNLKSTNIVLIGAAYAAGFIPVSLDALRQALRNTFPEKSWDCNLKALELGMEELKAQSIEECGTVASMTEIG
jgi:indolepyruvate ferredoxin oxidoreductase, beta subunit